MLIAYQVILLVIILIGFGGLIGTDEKEKDLRNSLSGVCIAAILAFTVSVWIL